MKKIAAMLTALALLLSFSACKERRTSPADITPPAEQEEFPSVPEDMEPPMPEPESQPEPQPENDVSESGEEPALPEEPQPQETASTESPQSQEAATTPPAASGETSSGEGDAPPQEVSASEMASQSQAETSRPSTQPAAPTSTATPFGYDVSQIARLYIRTNDYAYIPVDYSYWESILSPIKRAAQGAAEEIYSPTEGGFFVILQDGAKFSYTLIPTAVRVGNDAYPMAQEDYSSLLALSAQISGTGSSYIQWLVYMTPERVTEVSYHPSYSDTPLVLTGENIQKAARTLANVQVQTGSGNAYTENRSFAKNLNNTVIKLTFDSGIVYSIAADSGSIYIQSSDMTYGCSYKLVTSQASINKTFDTLL